MPTPTPILAVAFDLDGLIFDTEALFFRVAGEMLHAKGKAFTPAIMAAMIGRRAPEAYPALKAMAGLDESPEELLDEARSRFEAEIDSAVHPMPGLFALLAFLEKHEVPRAVTTSSRQAYARRLLCNHGLLDHFAFVLAAEDVTNGKPDPEIYLTAAKRFGIEPTSLLVLEDSPTGLAAAVASGAFAVGVPHEHSPAHALDAAALIATSLADPALFDRIRPRGDDHR